LAEVPAFSDPAKIKRVQFALQLNSLTLSHPKLMSMLQIGDVGLTSTHQLLVLGEQGLVDLIVRHDIAAPAGTLSETQE